MKSLFAIASLIVLGFATTSAANADPQSPESLTVQFGDLDLNKAQGADVLFKRIRNAAESVCRQFESRTLSQKRLHSECVDTALSTAVTRVDRPVLSRYVAERSTKPHDASVSVVSSR